MFVKNVGCDYEQELSYRKQIARQLHITLTMHSIYY